MEREKRTAFYEKLYFHELDAREKLISRLQFCMTFLVALIGAWVYVFSRLNFDAQAGMAGVAIFLVFYVVFSVLLIASSWHYAVAAWGHKYECIPSAEKIEEYRQTLHTFYKDTSGGMQVAEDEFLAFVEKYMCECSSVNSLVNDARYKSLHDSMGLGIYALLPLAIAGITFLVAGLGKPLP